MSEGGSIIFEVPGDAIPFARAGAQGKRRFTPKRQAEYMSVVKLFASQAMAGRPPFDGPVRMIVEAEYRPPASWSERKKFAASWKTSRPDADNLYKICADSLNGVVFVDDALVVDVRITKTYAGVSRLVVIVEPLA